MKKMILVQSQPNQNAINDILYVLRDRKMYINEKKLYINTIEILHKLGYYDYSGNNNEKASLFGELR